MALGWAIFLFLLCANFAVAALIPRDKPRERAEGVSLFTNSGLLHLKIQIPETNVAALRREPRKFAAGTLQEGDTVYQNLAIHLKGATGSFRPIDDKPGFTISFSTFESGTNFHGLRKFHLNNSVQDASYLSDWLSAELFRRAGVPAPLHTHAWVELNGRKLGLYVVMESQDEDFLSRFFKKTKGNLYGQSEGGDINVNLQRMEGKGPVDRLDLKALTAAAQERDPVKRLEKLKQTLDIDRFCSYMAIEVLLCDWDGYVNARHNYRVYQDLDNDGRMVFIPHDKDQMMGDMNLPFMPNNASLVATAILNTPETRLQYRSRFGELLTNVFVPSVLTNEIEQIVAKLMPGLTNYDNNFARNFPNGVRALKDRIINRRRGLEEQFGVPAPPRLQFASNVAPVLAWEAFKEQGNIKMDAIRAENRMLLHSQCQGGGIVCSWRTAVVLDPGTYRFTGNAKCANLQAHGSDLGAGAGIGILGAVRTNKLEKTMDWTPLAHEFSLSAPGEVVLLCELRAGKGEIWFDADSLQLEKLK
jgi:spore coat protein H